MDLKKNIFLLKKKLTEKIEKKIYFFGDRRLVLIFVIEERRGLFSKYFLKIEFMRLLKKIYSWKYESGVNFVKKIFFGDTRQMWI